LAVTTTDWTVVAWDAGLCCAVTDVAKNDAARTVALPLRNVGRWVMGIRKPVSAVAQAFRPRRPAQMG